MSMEQFLPKAIAALRPSEGAYYNSGNPILANKIVFDNKDISISQDDLDAKLVELQAEYDAQEYARNRKAEYDALNQLELISDDTNNGTTTHIDAVNAIKAKYPKPE